MNNLTIRLETKKDYKAVEALVREAFWNVYKPGCSEHYVLHVLRNDPNFVPELDFVVELNGIIIGQVVFMHADIKTDDGGNLPIMTFGPICIHPKYQRCGYGKCLLDFVLDKACKMGVGAICMEGNIAFYGKCGFVTADSYGIRYHTAPENEPAPYFLARELKQGFFQGITGTYRPPQGYFVDTEKVEIFDKSFPPLQKLKLPGQIFD